ncbi:hypothetical protein RHA1_ro00729 [Rhodococcus jostii RHA1]|uniref:Uncharacterized protein n=1 Tax=Rhodococcus jostii (strain RHA1) TaxID=101510 RepID=Q0SIS2_RHOJR|nr:hypothetical protein RHA1_ro00729 [Rhodococcus jostii RHA1]
MAMGASIPTASTEPIVIRPAPRKNISQTMAQRLPRTSLSAPATIRSTVPLTRAIPNSRVIPTMMVKMLPGKNPKMSSMDSPDSQPPITKAAANAKTPMLMGVMVPIANRAINAAIEMK